VQLQLAGNACPDNALVEYEHGVYPTAGSTVKLLATA
jgi:hypothetical protein